MIFLVFRFIVAQHRTVCEVPENTQTIIEKILCFSACSESTVVLTGLLSTFMIMFVSFGLVCTLLANAHQKDLCYGIPAFPDKFL